MKIGNKKTITDLAGTAPYIVRWSIALPFGISIKLHKILRPDDDRCAHDHPWWMLRVILLGGYDEECGPDHCLVARKPWRPWAPWRIHFAGNLFRHRITRLYAECSWSLVICGPSSNTWGFYTTQGWISWKAFVTMARSSRVLWCDDGSAINHAQAHGKDQLN